jgi:hypothetical protein
MKKFLVLGVLAVAAGLVAVLIPLGGTLTRAVTIDVSGPLNWSVQYLIDQSRTVGGKSQFDAPRDNRGLALSPDGQFLYAGYNNPSSNDPGEHILQVRKIDTTVADYDNATVAILEGFRGKAIATDDVGRVYLAGGTTIAGSTTIEIYDANLATSLFTISGLTSTEGVAVTRESGNLVLYATDRTNKTLTRWTVQEGGGGTVTGVTKAGLDGDGEITVTGASNLRGVEIDPSGRIWMADIGADKVFRVNSDGTGLTSVSVTDAIDIAFDDTQAFVTQYTQRTITVLKQSDMSAVTTLTPPWASLKMDPDGQSAGGALSGIVMGSGSLYVTNETGQTENEKSTYGRCDDKSDNPGGPCTFTDTTADDNDAVLMVAAAAPATPTPTPPPAGGVMELPADQSGSPDGLSVYYIALAGAAAAIVLATGAWYVRRRWLS